MQLQRKLTLESMKLTFLPMNFSIFRLSVLDHADSLRSRKSFWVNSINLVPKVSTQCPFSHMMGIIPFSITNWSVLMLHQLLCGTKLRCGLEKFVLGHILFLHKIGI